MHGSLAWIRFDARGRAWVHLGPFGPTCMGSAGFTWARFESFDSIHVDSLGLTWTHSDSLGPMRNHLDSLGLALPSLRYAREVLPSCKGSEAAKLRIKCCCGVVIVPPPTNGIFQLETASPNRTSPKVPAGILHNPGFHIAFETVASILHQSAQAGASILHSQGSCRCEHPA